MMFGLLPRSHGTGVVTLKPCAGRRLPGVAPFCSPDLNPEEILNPALQGLVATEVEPLDNFSLAEDYHQQYLERGGRFGNTQSAEKQCTDPIRCYG